MSSATSNSQSARSSLSSVSPLPAPNQLVDTSEDEEDREEDREEEEEEAHIHVQAPKIPLMNKDTIERVKKGEGPQKQLLFHLNIFIVNLWLQRSDLCQNANHLSRMLV